MFRAQARTAEEFAGSFAEPDLTSLRADGGFVEVQARLLGHSEFTAAKNGFDVFRRAAHQRDFKVVNEPRAIHCDPAHKAAIHEIDQERPEADLDDVASDSPNNGFTAAASIHNRIANFAQIFSGQNARKRFEKIREVAARFVRPSELFEMNFVRPVRERIGAKLLE